jgi:hypothetical protein
MTEQQMQIAAGIRAINTKYFDYLYGIKDLFDLGEVPTVARFTSEVSERGAITVIFINQKGISLKGEIKREIVDLYASVYDE